MKISCIYIFSHFDPNVNTEEAVSASKKMRVSMLPLGISYVATVLKQAGHEVKIICLTEKNSLDKFIAEITNSDLFCISINYYTSTQIAKKFIKKLKEIFPNKKIIVGGAYVTLYPDEIIENKNIDAICIGDGETAVLSYVNAVSENNFNKEIDNLFIRKTDGTILKCSKSNFIEDINLLPFIDRHMWDKWTFDATQHKVLVERGCQYRCTYCANHRFADISSGNYLRYRNISSIIDEFEYILKEYPQTESFMLYSENIASDNDYFFNLCMAIKEFNLKTGKPINYAIILNVTKSFVKNSKIFDAMKEANIKWVMFGFETASKEIRKKLNRPVYDNRDILKFCRQMQKRRIHTTVYVMYCYPYETYKTYKETVKWLKFLRPDAIGYMKMMLAKGTEIYDHFFVRKEENYNKPFFSKLIGKWCVITFKFRVYVSYKPFMETLFWFLKQFSIGSKLFLIWRRYNDLKRKKLEEYKNIAKNYFDNKNFKEAIKYLDKIAVIGDSWIYADRAFANFKLGKREKALKDINKAIELEKDNKNYHNLRDKIVN